MKKRKQKRKRTNHPRCAENCAGCCAGERCLAGTSDAACGQRGAPCAACANPTPTCASQVCAACTASSPCSTGSLCLDGVCQACDVCAGGCAYASPMEAVADLAGPATIRICAGTYRRNLRIDRAVTLIGAGDGTGAGTTILAGAGNGSAVTIAPGLRVTLRRLRITGGDTGATFGNGGGIHTSADQLVLAQCTVTGNHAYEGGGISNAGKAVHLTDSRISENTAAVSSGGIANSGALTLEHSDVTTNTALVGRGATNGFAGTLTLVNGSRISGNTATASQRDTGGGVYNLGVVQAAGGVITGNTPDDCLNFSEGTGCPG